jgi:LysR family glycine cleavage system transcriptional activator
MDTLPPLRALQVFDTLGRCQGVVEAARRLGVSPGAVSQQIKLLEDALGVRLLAREGKRLRLTEAGRSYHASCAAAFESLRVARADLERDKHPRNLNISALPSVLSKWLAPRVCAWQLDYPELDVFLDGSHSEPSPDARVDFRITYGERIDDAGTKVELFRDAVVPACSPRLIDSAAPLANPADILAYPLLSIDWLPKFSSPPSWRDWGMANEIDCTNLRDNRIVFSLSSVAIQAPIEAQGFVLAQTSMIADDVAAGRLIVPFPLGVPLLSPYFLTWQPRVFDQHHCRVFHRWLLTQGREQRALNDRLAPAVLAGSVPGASAS